MDMSQEYHEIDNLCKLAKQHKEVCNSPHCGIRIFLLKTTVDKVMQRVPDFDKEAAAKLISQIEWY